MRKIINHHIEGGTRESHPRVQDLQHPRLGKPRRGLQILDTRKGFPRPSLNVVLDYIILVGILLCLYPFSGRYPERVFLHPITTHLPNFLYKVQIRSVVALSCFLLAELAGKIKMTAGEDKESTAIVGSKTESYYKWDA